MPAQRLQWIKFWPEAIDHPKFAELNDSESWTWVVVWGKASMQADRWHFASVAHAAKVSGRPAKHVRRLIEVGLLDESTGGVYVHNAPKWQDRYPSDERPMGGPKTPRKVREDSANAPSTPDEHSLNGAATLPEESDKNKREIETNPPTPQGARRKNPVREPLTDADSESLVAKYSGQFGGRQGVLDEIASAMNHVARLKSFKERIYVDGWLRREVNRPNLRLVNNRIPPPPPPPRTHIDLTGTEN